MRRKVPFLGEEFITRDGDDESQEKRERGQQIDEIISTHGQQSTWDDLVSSDYPDPSGMPARVASPHASVAMPSAAPEPKLEAKPKPARSGMVPISPGPVLKMALMEANMSLSKPAAVGGASIDWRPINNGHSLRINICGNLDHNLRAEWRRLLAETDANGIGQFEFNLTQAPNLSLTGLGMLLLFKERKGAERGDIKLCHCNKNVWDLLQWSGMDKYFTIQGIPGNG